MLKTGRPMLETVIQQAKQREVPVHTIIRLGRSVANAVQKTVAENASDLIVMAWPGYTNSEDRLFGSVLDPIVRNPPADVAVVRYRQYRPLRSVLVPVAGGPNSRRVVKMAVNMAKAAEPTQAKVTLLHIVPPGANRSTMARAEQVFREAREGIEYDAIDTCVVEGIDVVGTILQASAPTETSPGADLIVIGATREPLLRNLFMGNIPAQVARRADVTVIMLKRRNNPIQSFLRQTIVQTEKRPDIR
jgi:CIC family chloride channel protein